MGPKNFCARSRFGSRRFQESINGFFVTYEKTEYGMRYIHLTEFQFIFDFSLTTCKNFVPISIDIKAKA